MEEQVIVDACVRLTATIRMLREISPGMPQSLVPNQSIASAAVLKFRRSFGGTTLNRFAGGTAAFDALCDL